MNGLEYICIKWNFSQSFLAEMIGVTRQAVSQWFSGETGLTNKRKVKLMEFFGLSDDLFGEMTPEIKHAVDNTPVHAHKKGEHEFWLARIDHRFIEHPSKNGEIPCLLKGSYVFPLIGDNKVELDDIESKDYPESMKTQDEELSIATRRFVELLERLRGPVYDTTKASSTRLNMATHFSEVLGPILDAEEKFRGHRIVKYYPFNAVYDCIMEDLLAGLGLAFGTVSESDLPADYTDGQDEINHAYGRKKDFSLKVEALMTEEINRRCQMLVDDERNKIKSILDIKSFKP